SAYIVITVILKGLAYQQFKNALDEQNIVYSEIQTRPSPMNTILWSANVDVGDKYLLANYSFFDSQPITFDPYAMNNDLLGNWKKDENVQRMIAISEGWYTIHSENDTLYFNDLRFGTLGIKPQSQDFVFKYSMVLNDKGEVEFTELPKKPEDGKQLLIDLWKRIQGN
ncbi:MAG: metal-dependent hydrolase, partial [Schleiferiaceae bacterium]|nr:metal-dependent hydrolase [Schleiferiaceae bacterium]